MGHDIELNATTTPAQVKLSGQGTFEIEAEKYLQIRHGNPDSPVVDLQEQCPPGKKWFCTIDIHITEEDE